MPFIEELLEKVKAEGSVEGAVTVLLNEIAIALNDRSESPTSICALADALDEHAGPLAAAVVDNTMLPWAKTEATP